MDKTKGMSLLLAPAGISFCGALFTHCNLIDLGKVKWETNRSIILRGEKRPESDQQQIVVIYGLI